MRYTGIGILSGGICFVILGYSGRLSGFYQNPMIQEGYLKHLVAYLGELFFIALFEIGSIVSIIGLLFLIPYLICSYQKFVKES